MTTDNKTPAVDVLAVIDGLSAIWRDESQIVGRWDYADELDSIRPAVAQMLSALQVAELALRERGLRACGEYKQIEAALARVKGE